jgi:tRNA modification GTPase
VSHADTIVALSTPPGRSGIGIIRIAGPHSLRFVGALLKNVNFNPEPNRVLLRTLYDINSEVILDKVLITYFKAPNSFTGEDIIELSCHGSPTLLSHIIDSLLELGARTADAGEFTLRALSNGKLNLSQAEAVRDLIDAKTYSAVIQASRQLNGEMSTRLQPVKEKLVELIVPLESALEFVEDDLPVNVASSVHDNLKTLSALLDDLADTFRRGQLLKNGLRVSLVGRPNVGKSSLFNALIASDRAIVTDIPGTTRDSLNETLSINGVPVTLTDTAGIREPEDKIEQLGIQRTERAISDSDLIIAVIDGSVQLTVEDADLLSQVSKYRHLVAVNKSDLKHLDISDVIHKLCSSIFIPVSATTGSGLDALRSAILEAFAGNGSWETEFLITNSRHYDLLRRTAKSIKSSEALLKSQASEELLLIGLYEALSFLGEITGETTSEDVLSQIFSTFCIGK